MPTSLVNEAKKYDLLLSEPTKMKKTNGEKQRLVSSTQRQTLLSDSSVSVKQKNLTIKRSVSSQEDDSIAEQNKSKIAKHSSLQTRTKKDIDRMIDMLGEETTSVSYTSTKKSMSYFESQTTKKRPNRKSLKSLL